MSISLSKLVPILFFGVLAGTTYAAVNFPFPQNSAYDGNGITLSDKATAATNLQSGFQHYLSTFYNESGNYAGIRSNEGSNEYFSEGMGYGMLLMVYFSNSTTSYQSQFDKLWAFYKACPDSNGLMNWKMGNLSPTEIWGKNAATDAEMDVAAALIMAAKQFGDDKYLTEVATLLAKVRQYEFETNGLHKPGDAWNDKKNPSYVAPAYYELFKNVDTEGSSFWGTTAMNANYTLLETNSAEYSTGLFDNWSNSSGTGLDGYYGYDAARTPWRLAQAYYWFGNTRAYTMLNKLGSWVATQNATNVSGSIQRNGTFGGDHNSTFIATLMTALVTSTTHQEKLDAFWNEAVSLGNENYFNQSMKLLCGLAVSGNMPNFAASATALPSTRPVSKKTFSVQGNLLTLENLSYENIQVDVFSLNGKQIRTLFRGPATQTLTLSLAGMKRGVYMVKLSQSGSSVTHKVIIR